LHRKLAWLWVQRVARWLLGGFFVFAGVAKLIGLRFSWGAVWLLLTKGSWSGIQVLGLIGFRDEVRNYKLGAFWPVVHPAAILMPWIEIVTGLALIFGIWVVESAVMIMAMLVFFNALVGSAMYRGLDIRCGCVGTDMRVGWMKITENLGLIVLGVIALIGHRRAAVLDRSAAAPVQSESANTQAG
jgi:Methylamine utilisation protein MauE